MPRLATLALLALSTLLPLAAAQTVAVDERHAYVLAGGELRKIDRETGEVVGRVELRLEPGPETTPSTGASGPEPRTVRFGRLVRVGGGGFCRLVSIGGRFLGMHSEKTFYGHALEGDEFVPGPAVALTPRGESDVDQDVATDGRFLYQFAMRRKPGGILRKFDDRLALVGESEVFGGNPDDLVLDQNLAFLDGKLYAGSEYREDGGSWMRRSGQQNVPPDGDLVRALRVRIFDTDLEPLGEKILEANVEGAWHPRQYWGLGASQLRADGYHCVVAASPIGDTSYFDEGESIGARQIFILRFDSEFRFVDSKGPLTDTSCDNFWCTGSWFDGERYYVSYTCRKKGEGCVPGPNQAPAGDGFPADSGNIRLAVVDRDFRVLETVEVTTLEGVDRGPGAHRSKIWKEGNRLFVSYDARGGAWIQEFEVK